MHGENPKSFHFINKSRFSKQKCKAGVRRRLAGSKFHAGDPQILGAGVQNSVSGAT